MTAAPPAAPTPRSKPVVITSPLTNEKIDLTADAVNKPVERVDRKIDVVTPQNVTVSEKPVVVATPVVTQAAAAAAPVAAVPSKLHSVNSNSHVVIDKKSDESSSVPSATKESVTDGTPKTPSRATPPAVHTEYEPVSPTPLADSPKANDDEDFVEGKYYLYVCSRQRFSFPNIKIVKLFTWGSWFLDAL